MKTTIVMPVSRPDFLHRVFAQLDMMSCKKEETNLLVYVDGDQILYQKAHNFVTNSKFNEKLCVYRRKGLPNVNHIPFRRKRIAAIHNEIKQIINFCDYVFLMEDDTLLPLNALEKLLKAYTIHPHAGFITGVQIGRWGMNVPGIWKVDNPYQVNKVESLLPDKDVMLKEIDAAGLYCCITKMDNYKKHNFEPFDTILGPDVGFGIALRKEGYKNYVDLSINTTHLTKRDPITPTNVTLQKITFTRIEDSKWEQELV